MKIIIEKHKEASSHLEKAASFHYEAVKHHEAGNHEKANHSTINANSQLTHAKKLEKEIQKQHNKSLFLFLKR